MKKIPSIMSVMTPFPYSIDAKAGLGEARAMMDDHGIRHLPVMSGGKLGGLVWARDVRVARSVGAGEETGDDVEVGTVCNQEPLVVDVTERLDNVVMKMSEGQNDAAVVLKGDKLAGILTTTDVCRLLGELLRSNFGPAGGTDAA